MTYSEYKKIVMDYFIEKLGAKEAEELMNEREDEVQTCYEEGMKPEGAGIGIIMNLL